MFVLFAFITVFWVYRDIEVGQVFIRYQTIAFILSFFGNVVSELNQIDSSKNAQDDLDYEVSILNHPLY